MLLSARNIEAFYGGTRSLHGVSFDIAEGGATALLGANGAGKTTILRALCGMVRVTGEIVFDGAAIAGRATEDIVRLGVAHVPEGRGTFVRLTVEENLALGAMTRRPPRHRRRHGAHLRYVSPPGRATRAAGWHAIRW